MFVVLCGKARLRVHGGDCWTSCIYKKKSMNAIVGTTGVYRACRTQRSGVRILDCGRRGVGCGQSCSDPMTGGGGVWRRGGVAGGTGM